MKGLGMMVKGYGVSFWDGENVLRLIGGNDCTTLNILKTMECVL